MDTFPALLDEKSLDCWYIDGLVQCGFPSPASDHSQRRIDLNEILLHQPDATYYMRVRGSSMCDIGLDDGDCIIIDRSLKAQHGDIVLAIVDGEFTVKSLYQQHGKVQLKAANPSFPDLTIHDGQELQIWGVVTWIIKQASRKNRSR